MRPLPDDDVTNSMNPPFTSGIGANHAMVIPLMAASLIAYATSGLVSDEGIYHALAKRDVP
jgi:H+/Cl- antiporter ClcA